MLSILPNVLSCNVVGRWIDLKSLARLDSAHCNHTERKSFEALLASTDFVFHSPAAFCNPRIIEWLLAKGIKFADYNAQASSDLRKLGSFMQAVDIRSEHDNTLPVHDAHSTIRGRSSTAAASAHTSTTNPSSRPATNNTTTSTTTTSKTNTIDFSPVVAALVKAKIIAPTASKPSTAPPSSSTSFGLTDPSLPQASALKSSSHSAPPLSSMPALPDSAANPLDSLGPSFGGGGGGSGSAVRIKIQKPEVGNTEATGTVADIIGSVHSATALPIPQTTLGSANTGGSVATMIPDAVVGNPFLPLHSAINPATPAAERLQRSPVDEDEDEGDDVRLHQIYLSERNTVTHGPTGIVFRYKGRNSRTGVQRYYNSKAHVTIRFVEKGSTYIGKEYNFQHVPEMKRCPLSSPCNCTSSLQGAL